MADRKEYPIDQARQISAEIKEVQERLNQVGNDFNAGKVGIQVLKSTLEWASSTLGNLQDRLEQIGKDLGQRRGEQ